MRRHQIESESDEALATRCCYSSRRNDCGCGNGCGFDVCPSITIGSENKTVVIMNVRVRNIV